MKKIIALILSLTLVGSSFVLPFTAYNVMAQENTVTEENESTAEITQFGGWHESIYINWTNDSNATEAAVYYKLSESNEYILADSELVRATENGGRVDIVGIKAGYYDVRIDLADGTSLYQTNIPVDNYDRSGYAHFNNTAGVGGYNDDGTPKENAIILYVTNDTKNTVECEGYKGIGNILYNAAKISKPLIVRFIGTIDTQTRDADGSKTTDIKNGVVAINGLVDNVLNNDSYFNMCDVSNASNITIEGIGTDATVEKWGFNFKKSKYIEVRNLRFTKYPEDACSFSGSDSAYCSNLWLHNCTFDIGDNKYDLTDEQDKHEGDGSTDISKSYYVTLSYNRFNNCHKTSLHGGSDEVEQYHITWHHNYFNKCSSRLPLVRHTNVHIYNNYYYGASTCIDARASAWVFSENNYFEKSKNCFRTTASSSQGTPVVKSMGDVFVSSSKTDNTNTIYTTSNRAEVYSVASNKNPYPNFDTDPALFYYSAGKSDVTLLETAEQAKENCVKNSGVLTGGGDIPVVPPTTETTTEVTTEVVEIPVSDPVADYTPSDVTPTGENSVTYREETNDYYILDRSDNTTTTWTVPFETQKSGVIVIKGSVTPKVSATKWAIVQVKGLNSAGAEESIASLAVDAESSVCLRANADTYVKTSNMISADRQYDYKLVLDLENKTATLTINGETVGADIDVAEIYAVQFITAKVAANRDVVATLPSIAKVVESEILLGDVNLDGKIQAEDAALALQYTLNKASVEIDAQGLANAEVTKNGVIDAEDAAAIMQKVLVSTFEF